MSYPYGQFPSESTSNPSTPHDAFSPWETVESEQQRRQSELQYHGATQPPPPTPTASTPYHQTIQLEEPPHLVPSQVPEAHDNTPVRLHHVLQQHEHGRAHESRSETYHGDGETGQLPHIDTRRKISPAASGPSSMVARPTRHHPQASHPYRRPTSAAPSAQPGPSRQSVVRFSAPPPHHPGSAMPSPGGLASRHSNLGSVISSPVINQEFHNTLLGTPAAAAASAATSTATPRKRPYIIRGDVHYDSESKVLTAILDLPGVKRADVHVSLSTCRYNRVRQITVSGVLRPVFPLIQDHDPIDTIVRERKFGEFTRTFAVPSDIKLQDIDAVLEDGVLNLRVNCGPPAESEELQAVPIR